MVGIRKKMTRNRFKCRSCNEYSHFSLLQPVNYQVNKKVSHYFAKCHRCHAIWWINYDDIEITIEKKE